MNNTTGKVTLLSETEASDQFVQGQLHGIESELFSTNYWWSHANEIIKSKIGTISWPCSITMGYWEGGFVATWFIQQAWYFSSCLREYSKYKKSYSKFSSIKKNWNWRPAAGLCSLHGPKAGHIPREVRAANVGLVVKSYSNRMNIWQKIWFFLNTYTFNLSIFPISGCTGHKQWNWTW